MHARLMIEGFMSPFVFGFLGTALPRLTGTPPLSRVELSALVVLLFVAMGLHIGHQHQTGDGVFLAALLLFIGGMAARFSRREESPPPSFVLVAFGFASALLGIAAQFSVHFSSADLRTPALGLLLLNEGFLLYLILGVGGFLLPRFLGVPLDRESTPAEFRRRVANALATAAMILASFVIEVFGSSPILAGILRFGAAGLFLIREGNVLRRPERSSTVSSALRIGVILLLLGLLFPVIWPLQRVAGLHLVFIGGFSLVTFCVATRVVLGHSGQGDRVRGKLPFLSGAVVLLLLAAILRIVADFQLPLRGRFLEFASYVWMLAAAVWSWRILPNVRIPDTEETP
jgi:uncharacterized protein involved in response to NO